MPPKDQNQQTDSQVDDDDQQQDAANQPAADQQQGESTASPEYEDAQLATAMRELEMENQGDDGPEGGDQSSGEPAAGEQQKQGEGEQGTQPQKPESGQQPAEGDGSSKVEGDGQQQPAGDDSQQAPMIPKPRFDQEVGRLRKTARDLELENAYLKGQLQTRAEIQQQTADQQQQQTAEKTPDEKLADLYNEKTELWSKWENGDMPTPDRIKAEAEIDGRIHSIRMDQVRAEQQQQLQSQQQGQQPGPAQPVSDAYVEMKTREILDSHPYISLMGSRDDPLWAPRWDMLQMEAISELQAEGVELRENSQASDLLVRQRVGVLSDKYGPMWTGKSPEEVGSAAGQNTASNEASGNNGQQQGQQGRPQMSQQAQQRADKLDVENRQPPDTSSLGSPGARTEVTEADIEKMSEEEIMSLPEADRRKFAPLN